MYFEEPYLWREGTDSELNYPYDLGGLASITNSNAGPEFSYYYFFYEWDLSHCLLFVSLRELARQL